RRGGIARGIRGRSAQAAMEQQHMTQVATVVAGTNCLTLVMMLKLSFFSSPHTVYCACPARGLGQVVTRGTPPHVEGCRSVGRGHATDAQDLGSYSRDAMHDVSTKRAWRGAARRGEPQPGQAVELPGCVAPSGVCDLSVRTGAYRVPPGLRAGLA